MKYQISINNEIYKKPDLEDQHLDFLFPIKVQQFVHILFQQNEKLRLFKKEKENNKKPLFEDQHLLFLFPIKVQQFVFFHFEQQ